MELREIVGTLIEAADKHADNLHELVMESDGEARAAYQGELDKTNEAVDAARQWLAIPENGKPPRVVADFTGGLFHGAYSNVAVGIIAVDSGDKENPRANVPGFGDAIWAEIQDADVDPGNTNAAFDGAVWLADNSET
jgi:hypothetical protein